MPLYAGARAIAEAVGDPGLNAELRVGLSRYYRRNGNGAVAYSWADDADTIATRSGNHEIMNWALIERARAAWLLGDHEAAGADLQQAIERARAMDANYDRTQALLLLAALQFQQDDSAYEATWLEASSLIVSGGYAFLLDRERSWSFPLLAAGLNGPDPDLVAVSARLLQRLENVPPPPLQVRTLGRFEVIQGVRPVPEQAWRLRRAGELFRLLLISPDRSLYRDQVTEALWPERATSSIPALFHKATSALRRTLEPDLPDKFPSRYLVVEEGRVTLQLPAGSTIDLERFEEAVRQNEWERAIALYQGELYPADRYADWAAETRERLVHHFVRAALAAGADRLAAGRPNRALDACRRVLALDPWQEEAVLLGMQACIALGDRTGAIRLYRELERTLQDELGIAPQASLQTLYQSLF